MCRSYVTHCTSHVHIHAPKLRKLLLAETDHSEPADTKLQLCVFMNPWHKSLEHHKSNTPIKISAFGWSTKIVRCVTCWLKNQLCLSKSFKLATKKFMHLISSHNWFMTAHCTPKRINTLAYGDYLPAGTLKNQKPSGRDGPGLFIIDLVLRKSTQNAQCAHLRG
jgi:hypothetical protein